MPTFDVLISSKQIQIQADDVPSALALAAAQVPPTLNYPIIVTDADERQARRSARADALEAEAKALRGTIAEASEAPVNVSGNPVAR